MKEKDKKNNAEDSTKYGEFISSYYHWISVEKQKEKTKHLEDITKEE